MTTGIEQHGRARRLRPTLRVTRRPEAIVALVPSDSIEVETRRSMISEAAYFLAEHRGFAPGHELDDWLAAETLVDLALASVKVMAVHRELDYTDS